MKRLLLSGALLGAFLAPALAQVNTVPAPGLGVGYIPKVTYSSAFFGFVPFTSATDEVCISGSASRVIRVDRISIGGTASSIINVPVTVLRRNILDTGGAAATTTASARPCRARCQYRQYSESAERRSAESGTS